MRRSAFARLCVPPCSRTDRTPCQHPEGMDHPASVLFLLQMTRHLVAAREQGAAAAAGPRAFGCGHRCLIYPLRAVSLGSTGRIKLTEPKMSPTHDAPYRGLRVLDFGQGIASPYCAMLLGVYGAEVIKVEPPEGDWSRYLGTTYGSHTALSAVYNRGKHSLCLDLKHDEGIRIARRLASDCDVFIEGFRPGVAARLGIGYEDLARDNPGLIYLSVSGFGQDGPYSKRPGRTGLAQRFRMLRPGFTHFRPSQPRCSRARPLARAAGSMSVSHNRRLRCLATRLPSMFWRGALRAHSMYRRAPIKQGMAGSWSPW